MLRHDASYPHELAGIATNTLDWTNIYCARDKICEAFFF
jgi:hypothetical protein